MDTTTLSKLANWSAPKEINTKNGPRMLRTAAKTDAFSTAWKHEKDAMKAIGASWTKDERSGEWSLVWWQKIDEEELAKRAQAIKDSRATDAEIELPHPEGYDYMPFQRAGIRYGLDRKGVLIGDDMGLGKQQPIDTNVLTPNGWRMIGWLRPGDKVIGSTGQAVNVTGVFPQGFKPSYRVTMSDGSSAEAGPEHLWTVRYYCGGRRWAELTLTTQQLLDRPVIEIKRGKRTSRLDLAKTALYLPMLTGPVVFDEQEPLLIAPYTLGQMIANGALTGSTITISTNINDGDEIYARIKSEGSPISETMRTYGNVRRLAINHKTILAVRAMGLNVHSASKFIPARYKFAAPADRIALLQGLMDGDGCISKEKNKIAYTTTGKRLAYDVVELVEGLGGIASVREYPRTDGKPTDYQVRVRLPVGIKPFSISRKAGRYHPGRLAHPVRTIKSVEYVRDTESVCIAVDAPDRLYATEHCILTHNTVQAIGIINAAADIDSAIIICPKSLKLNWYRELTRWLVKPLTVGVADKVWPDTDIVIVNYEGLNKFSKQSLAREWGASIADEAHLIKNRKTVRSMNVKAIRARRVIRMTGTPIVNRPLELHNIISDLHPQWANFMSFAKRYCGAQKDRFGWQMGGATNLDELQEKLRATVMVRRLKSQVLTELPRKIRQIIEVEATGAAGKAVKAERAFEEASEERLANLRAAVELSKAEGEEAYQSAVARLKEASSVDFTEMAKLRHDTAMLKVPAVIEHIRAILEDDDQQKVFVACHHHDVVDALAMGLLDFHPVAYTGETKEKDRQSYVDRFQTDESCRVFIGSIMAAGVGITLTRANIAIFAELDWVPGNITQAEDRLHRIGQTETVLVQHLVLADSLDARMARILVSKQAIIDQALDINHPARQQPEYKPSESKAREDAYQPKKAAATHGTSVDELTELAAKLTESQLKAAHVAMQMLAGNDLDRAQAQNGIGFNKIDGNVGHDLAMRQSLSPKAGALAWKLAHKYRGQLPPAIIEALEGEQA